MKGIKYRENYMFSIVLKGYKGKDITLNISQTCSQFLDSFCPLLYIMKLKYHYNSTFSLISVFPSPCLPFGIGQNSSTTNSLHSFCLEGMTMNGFFPLSHSSLSFHDACLLDEQLLTSILPFPALVPIPLPPTSVQVLQLFMVLVIYFDHSQNIREDFLYSHL